jgi:transcriptional regulator with XRE-family HTH domain
VPMSKRRPKKREEIVRQFAQRLREVRLLRGMTQADLAQKADVAVTYISGLEGGDTAPGIDLVDRLANALGTTAAELLPSVRPPDAKAVLQDQAQQMFEQLIRVGECETFQILNPFLALLLESASKRR